ncbi:hypothetical protein R1sor_014080 [Riccia sorocarpa]|uniref:Uncharacterized protein n=1 Tax=Riccia sorocarpa TaxID=122646 RepID=A0ABD3HA84_9MARC
MLGVVVHRIPCAPLDNVREKLRLESTRRRRVSPVRAVAGAAREEGKVRRVRINAAAESSGGFVKPLRDFYPRLPCRHCKGKGEIVCDKCVGEGKLSRGGWHKKNPVDLDRIIGSKWTAMESTFGWRHFRVHCKKRGPGKEWFVEMSATCDESTRFWVNAKNLKERERWSMGWLQKTEILAAKDEKNTPQKLVCKACKGRGVLPCICTLRPNDELTLDIIEI